MDRRALLSHLATAIGATALAPLVLPIIGKGPPDVFGEAIHGQLGETLSVAEFYNAYGHIKADDAIAFHIKAVLLDGEDITREGVLESDDRAGWVLCIARPYEWRVPDVAPKTVRRTGDVRYVWSEEALT